MRTAITAVSLAALALALASCASAPKADGARTANFEPINDVCPISGHEVPDIDAPTVTYQGHTIAVCCDACVEAWPNENDEWRQEVLTEMLSADAN
ncbi:MAG: hypothetical protein AAGI53_04925 [Planctomycetota bacterium]